MDVRIRAFQDATSAFAYLARLDMPELTRILGDERLVDGMQNGRAQKFEYTTEMCWKTIKIFLSDCGFSLRASFHPAGWRTMPAEHAGEIRCVHDGGVRPIPHYTST